MNSICKLKIERISFIKYPGTHIDPSLNWNIHIQYINSKTRKTIRKFEQLLLPITNSKVVYSATAESDVRACIYNLKFKFYLKKDCCSHNG